jgi:hypothetical protein
MVGDGGGRGIGRCLKAIMEMLKKTQNKGEKK